MTIEAIEKYAHLHHIPIMLKDGIEYLTHYIAEHQCFQILELGTAIGYSAIRMAQVSPKVHVTTVERDETLYQIALKHAEQMGVEQQITFYHEDAFDITLTDQYDLIFIDAAKSQYVRLFEKFACNLKPQGVIIADNLNFHGLTWSNDPTMSRNVRGLTRHLREYIEYLQNNPHFTTTFLDVGDGLAISVKKD